MSKGNTGYRLGLFIRYLHEWAILQEDKATQQGLPRWVTKAIIALIMVAIGGLLVVYATFFVVLIALFMLIAFFIANTKDDIDSSDEQTSLTRKHRPSREGYHTNGPDGAGTYVAGRKISDDDEELTRFNED